MVGAGVLLANNAVLGLGGPPCRYGTWKYGLCNPADGRMPKTRIPITSFPYCTDTSGSEPCNLDCVMAFDDWSTITTCLGGFYTRTEKKVSRAWNNGTDCPPAQTQKLPCKVDCVMEFSDWSTCDKATGLQTRMQRMKTAPQAGGLACPAAQIETIPCRVDCEVKYPAWDPALHVCDKASGTRTRTQVAVYEPKLDGTTCTFATDSQTCAVDCELSYQAWGSATCDKDTGLMSRTQVPITEKNGGAPCADPETEFKKCQVDCAKSMGPVSACDKVTGTTKSSEYISVQPKNGGNACAPLKFVTTPCAVECEMKFPSWDPLIHQCDKVTGQRVRYEEIVQLPNALGNACPTPKKDVMDCPVNCEMKLPEWSAAQHPCDPATGLQTRTQVVAYSAKNGGTPCGPPQSDSRKCVVDCKFEYPDWDSVTCNKLTGVKTATQYQVAVPKSGGAACPAAQTLTQTCAVDAEFKFPDWDPTVHLCDKATGLRTRTEVVAIEGKNGGKPSSATINNGLLRKDVVACAVDCELTWPNWSADLHPCDKNTGLRTRKQIPNVLTQNGGRNCPLPAQETIKCPVDCETGFPDWNSIPCQISNTKTRAQVPIVATKNGGKTCVFQNPEVQLCQYISGGSGNFPVNYSN